MEDTRHGRLELHEGLVHRIKPDWISVSLNEGSYVMYKCLSVCLCMQESLEIFELSFNRVTCITCTCLRGWIIRYMQRNMYSQAVYVKCVAISLNHRV